MKVIRELSEMIEEELDGAEEYARCALHYKEEFPDVARVLYDISMQEMNHVNMLHGEVVAVIEKHRRERGDPPAAMMAVYEYVHKKHIDKLAEAKRYQDLFKR
jgi:rubrerythrin